MNKLSKEEEIKSEQDQVDSEVPYSSTPQLLIGLSMIIILIIIIILLRRKK